MKSEMDSSLYQSEIPLRVFDLEESRAGLMQKDIDLYSPTPEVPEMDNPRIVCVGHSSSEKFESNEVTTSKYSIVTWAPKSLLWQFKRSANIYFLIISILTALPFSPKNPVSMIGTFSSVLIFTMFKEAYEDYFRHKQDRQVNNLPVHVLRDGEFVKEKSKNLKVGDIVEVRDNEFIPADMLFLSSSHPKGLAFVNTMNLDGETNLKEKLPLASFVRLNDLHILSKFVAEVWCDQPNPNMHNWNCIMRQNSSDWQTMGFKQFLVRGSVLKNTDSAFGVVVYTGHDTKIMLNSKHPPSKMSDLFRKMNKILYTVFGFQLSICVLFASLNMAWVSGNASDHTYLDLDSSTNAGDFFTQILTFWVAYSHLVPISLYVALEVLKLAQAYLISQDLAMYYEEDDKPANSRNSDLVEELGQVEFVFSDKTGTLTQNLMEFKKFSVDGSIFEADSSVLLTMQDVSAKHHESFHTYFRLLALCHSAFPTTDNDKINYQAPSPDELALVQAAYNAGVKFTERSDSSIVIKNPFGATEEWEILAEIPFTSDRKRMSIVLRDPKSRKAHLMTKGADSIMYGLLEMSPTGIEQIIYKFAVDGLRTLVMAQKELSEPEVEAWVSQYKKISLSNSKDKEDRIFQLAETIEQNMQYVGISAIEDKLQDGVPETIELLLSANIRVWVLTGDKQETAVEIGKSCNILQDDMTVLTLTSNTKEELERKLKEYAELFKTENKSLTELEDLKKKMVKMIGVVVDGVTLSWIMNSAEFKHEFFKLGFLAKSCICCRVTPLQKLQVVALAKEHGPWVTLSIGDGANDVSMIQEAHIGIGIAGKEGTQAVQSSDFAIAQFSFLGTLLLVHGRWAYKRVSWFICYYFYKNIVLVFTELFFAFFNGFSGQIYFLDWLPMLYNSFWTSWPCMIAYVFEQDVSAEDSKRFPFLYGAGQKGVYFNFKVFWIWVAQAAWHGIICYWVPVTAFPSTDEGIDTGLWWISTLSFTLVIHLVTIKLFIESASLSYVNIIVGLCSVFFYYMSVLVLSTAGMSETFQPEATWVLMNLLGYGKTWIGIVCLPLLALIPDLIYATYMFIYWPTPTQYINRK